VEDQRQLVDVAKRRRRLTTGALVDVAQVGDLALEGLSLSGSSLRQTIDVRLGSHGLRSSVTECCVGLVFCSPDGPMNGTSVTWM